MSGAPQHPCSRTFVTAHLDDGIGDLGREKLQVGAPFPVPLVSKVTPAQRLLALPVTVSQSVNVDIVLTLATGG